ncbi:hypothetical protein LTR84_012846 [Exophiala bonariae]|uniref:Ketoreductase domain-containing protein n=1 Tax=Exophiala bonariae TaxID=1690606 RepID=A0AAV9NDB7_9EURO|nr:hypothetical protein LTR84_012846 [Exophiala bonariae]
MAPFPSPTSTWRTGVYPSISPTRPELSAKGKTVVITGGGTGIGAETARYFAEAGASLIALLGRREQPLQDTKAAIEGEFPNVKVVVSSTDITNKVEVENAFAKVVGDKKIDVLVSNAAMIGPQEAVGEADDTKLLDAVSQNLSGSLYIAQAFLHHAAADAVAIDVSSSAAHMNFLPRFAAYSVSKMAVFRLWDSVAFAHPELSVYHVQPGVVDTAMNRESAASIKGLEHLIQKDDVSLPAGFHVWLASPEARFLKGRFLWANWDVDELMAQAKDLGASEKLTIGLNGWPFPNSS